MPRHQRPIILKPAEDRIDTFKKCSAFVVPDNSLTPWFARGQLIYLEESTEPRKHDYIAISVSTETEANVQAVFIGKFLYRSRVSVCIELANGEEHEIDESQIGEIYRIAFCAF